jgi:hypothetical protein
VARTEFSALNFQSSAQRLRTGMADKPTTWRSHLYPTEIRRGIKAKIGHGARK